MNNFLLQVKIKQRLNKLASGDYDNIEAWQIIEAFNKVQIEWVRDQLGGNNSRREGDEQSRRLIDDLQNLLISYPLPGTNKTSYFESTSLPADYMEFKRVLAYAEHLNCPEPRKIKVDLAEEGNAEDYLRDTNTKPDWDWAETFCTLFGNRVKIYTDNLFKITEAQLIYYRFPRNVLFAGITDPSTGVLSSSDSTCEFKNDITEILIDLTAAQLAGDLENFNQLSRNKQNADLHN
jgi:hypothetical protein